MAMGRIEDEVNKVETAVSHLISQLESVMMPKGSDAPPPGLNPNTLPAPPSPVTNHLNGMSERLSMLTSRVREAHERLDV